jgi:sterol desaturase/sphingolipid hydroxylase (fatty acid hydroxylase superfamily)
VQLPYLAFVITFAATMALYYAGYESLHFLMHKPSVPFIERSRIFQFIKRHHRIHHFHMNRNLNVLLPLADLVLGTLVTKAPAPVATPESARQLARRHSRFARANALSLESRTTPQESESHG